MNHDFFTFLSAGEVVFGENALLQLKAKCDRLGVTKPMVVTTGLKRSDIIPRVRELLPDAVLYDRVSPEPRSSQALECVELAQKNSCNGFVGVGGGSPLDLAKVSAVLDAHGGRPRDYIGENNVPGPVSPIIAVPTTAGSGSEVTSVASLAHDDQGDYFKAGLSDNHLRPRVAIVDPLLLKFLPPHLTAECGLDALAHSIEALTAVDYRYVDRPERSIFNGGNPIAATLAERSISLIFSNLRKAVYQPQNREAQYNMALASVLAGMSFGSAGLGAVHASYYVVSEKTGSTHSFTVGTLLPHVMRFNMRVDPEPYARIAAIIGVGDQEGDLTGMAEAAVAAVADLVRDLGLPANLAALAVKQEDLPALAKTAMHHDRLHRGNMRKMSEGDFVALLHSAL